MPELCIPISQDKYYTTTGTRRQHYFPTMRLVLTPEFPLAEGELDDVD
jgi:hypothetical protein